jgi:site-specific DNA recombinase
MAAIYARVSPMPEGENGNFSIASQVRALTKLAASKGYRSDAEFHFIDDNFMGGELDRPALTRMREAVRAGVVQAVICYDPDRLARKLAHQLLLTEEFDKYGARLEFVTMPVDSSPESQMLLSMKGVFAEYEKAKIRERTMRGRREKALQGHVNGGRAAFGYRYEGKKQGKRGELVIVPEQADVVRLIFQWADEGAGPLEIARRLTAQGVPTASGRPWAKPVIAQMLRNRVYIGEGHYNRTTSAEPKEERRRKPAPPGRSKKTSKKRRPESEWIPVPAPAIIDRALFDRVRVQMERNRHLNGGRPANYPLRGLLKCAACGFACCVYPNHGKPRYRCRNINRLTYERQCQQPSQPVQAIEDAVWSETMDAFRDPARLWKLMLHHFRSAVTDQPAVQKQRASLERDIQRLKQREFRAAQSMLDAELADVYQTFRSDLKASQAARRDLERRLAALQPMAVIPQADLEQYCRETLAMLEAAMDPEVRRETLRKVIERIDMDKTEIVIHFRLFGLPQASKASAINCISRIGDIGAGN